MDWNAVERGLKNLQKDLDNIERADAVRRRREEAEQRQYETDREQRQQKEIAQRQSAAQTRGDIQENLLTSLAPPPEWSRQLIFNHKLLEASNSPASGSIDVFSKGPITTSEDGEWIAFINTNRQLVMQSFTGTNQKIIGPANPEDIYYLSLVGNQSILVHGRSGVTLTDLQGRTLKSWPKDNWSVFVTDGTVISIDQDFLRFKPTPCTQIAVYDARGKTLSEMSLKDKPADRCIWGRNAQEQSEITLIRGNNVTVHRNSQEVAAFSGDDRTGDTYSKVQYKILNDLRYAISWLIGRDEKTNTLPYRVWDISANKLLCEVPKSPGLGFLQESRSGRVSTIGPPAFFDVANCKMKPIALTSGTLTLDDDLAVVFDEATGRLTILDPESLAVRSTVQTDLRGGHLFRTDRRSPYVIVGRMAVGDENASDFSQVFDIRTGQLVQQPKGRLARVTPRVDFTLLKEMPGLIKITKIMQPSNEGKSSIGRAFADALQKDKYETVADYRNRIEKLTLPYEIDFRVLDYHADEAYFEGTYRGVAIGLPMSPSQARRLDGQSMLKIRGQLSVIDETYMELRSASVVLPDGTTIQVPQKKLPPQGLQATNKKAANVVSQQGVSVAADSIATPSQAKSGIPVHCTDAGLTKLIEPDIANALSTTNLCDSASNVNRVAAKALQLANNCPSSAPGIVELRKQMTTLINDSKRTMDGSCFR